MKRIKIIAIGIFVALFSPFLASAAVVLSIPQGGTLVNVTQGNTNPLYGATTTATANISVGQIVYIDYCITMNNGGFAGLFHSDAAYSRNFQNIASDPDTFFAGTNAQYCRSATTTAGYPMTAGDDYFVSFPVNGVWAFQTADMNTAGDFYQLADTPINPPDTSTHVISVTPANNSVIATSTTITLGANVYINPQQWIQALAANNGNWFVQMTITPASVVTGIPSAAGAFDAAFGTRVITFQILGSNSTNFSTTTSITDVGVYNISTQIIQPSPYNELLTWFGFGSAKVLAATSTRFTASYKTGFDTLTGSTTSIIDDFFASSSPQLIASCASFTGFNLGDCLNLLFIPQSGDLGRVMNDLNNGVFAYAPFGYVTRMLEILNGQATSTFPMLSTSFPDPSSPSEMMTYTFDQNEALAGAGNLLDNLTIPQDPAVNVRDSMDLIVKTIIALSVISYVFYDLAHSSKASHNIKTKLS